MKFAAFYFHRRTLNTICAVCLTKTAAASGDLPAKCRISEKKRIYGQNKNPRGGAENFRPAPRVNYAGKSLRVPHISLAEDHTIFQNITKSAAAWRLYTSPGYHMIHQNNPAAA